jgi:membrane-associated phospholipid phosphatase
VVFLTVTLLIGHPVRAPAQTNTASAVPASSTIHWWHGAAVLGGISALMLLDDPGRTFFQDHRSPASNEIAANLRHFGQPEVYGLVTVGLLGGGLLSGDQEVARAGAQLAVTLAVTAAFSTGFKLTAGRPRPYESLDPDGFVPLSGQDAMPSGHTAMAFAMATSLSDNIHRTWASIGLYTMAAGVGWSRLNDNKHWLTDVAMGAVVGVTSAKLINGRWQLFHLRPPTVLVEPKRAGLAWQVPF